MLFRSREAPSLFRTVRLWLWPRVSWRRSGSYFLKRLLRLSGTPYAIGMGAAVGTFASCTPFLGFHIMLAFGLAWVCRANLIAGAIGTSIGNPLTFPFIWAGSYELGQVMLGEVGKNAPGSLEHDLLHKSWDQLWPLVWPMTVGSAPLGIAAGCAVYVIVYKAVSAYRKVRHERFAERREADARESDDRRRVAEDVQGW
jgi:hypothetical protein